MEKIVAIGGGENGRGEHPYETGPFDREIVRLTDKDNPNFLFIGLANSFADSYYATKMCIRDRDESARRTLIERNLRLVVYIARKFETTGIGIEDLISIGTIGLIKAVNTFCPEKNIKLATYASRCIENEILMYLRKRDVYKRQVRSTPSCARTTFLRSLSNCSFFR